jgi:hypothetical protein
MRLRHFWSEATWQDASDGWEKWAPRSSSRGWWAQTVSLSGQSGAEGGREGAGSE